MKSFIHFFIFHFFVFFFFQHTSLHSAGIHDDFVPQTGIPRQLREIVNENRDIALPPVRHDIESIIEDLFPPIDSKEDVRIAEILWQNRVARGTQIPAGTYIFDKTDHLNILLSHEQLKEDILFLFDLLRHGYGGYYYFGGDNVFLPIRNEMLQQLIGMDNPLQVSSFLNNIILPSFRGVITDNHFQIQKNRFVSPNHSLYLTNEFIIYKNENIFITEIDGVLHRINKVTHNGQQLNGILPTITSNGVFCWTFGLIKEVQLNSVSNAFSGTEITVYMENTVTGEVHSRTVGLNFINSPMHQTHPIIEISESDGVTIMLNRNLSYTNSISNSIIELTNFFRSAAELQDKPVLIIDLRCSNGGDPLYARDWVRLYTGHEPDSSLFYIVSNRQQSLVETELKDFNIPYTVSVEGRLDKVFREIISHTNSATEHSFDISLQVPIQNNNFVIVLIDKNVASAGEIFIGYLRQLKKCVICWNKYNGSSCYRRHRQSAASAQLSGCYFWHTNEPSP